MPNTSKNSINIRGYSVSHSTNAYWTLKGLYPRYLPMLGFKKTVPTIWNWISLLADALHLIGESNINKNEHTNAILQLHACYKRDKHGALRLLCGRSTALRSKRKVAITKESRLVVREFQAVGKTWSKTLKRNALRLDWEAARSGVLCHTCWH